MTSGIVFAIALVMSLVATLILERKFIPYLMRMKLGQMILDIGPRWHKSKEGTPTMGGIFFIAPIAVITIVFSFFYFDKAVVTTLIMMLLFGVIGFIDDRTKLLKKQNAGLTAIQKLLLQLVVSAGYVAAMSVMGYTDTALKLPFTDATLELGALYYVFSVIFISFTVNSVNLTDGVDGLAGSVTLVIASLFSVYFIISDAIPYMPVLGAVAGGLIGFLCYNINPARIFMGDTGSLFLGGFVVGAAYLIDCPLIVVFAGLWYMIESASVMIQVFSFKVFHRRVFKMSPIHHHFEMCGWSEHKIVRRFSIFTAIMCIVAFFAFLV